MPTSITLKHLNREELVLSTKTLVSNPVLKKQKQNKQTKVSKRLYKSVLDKQGLEKRGGRQCSRWFWRRPWTDFKPVFYSEKTDKVENICSLDGHPVMILLSPAIQNCTAMLRCFRQEFVLYWRSREVLWATWERDRVKWVRQTDRQIRWIPRKSIPRSNNCSSWFTWRFWQSDMDGICSVSVTFIVTLTLF